MIGASGAISGLMGALTVMFGLSRIKVFFSTGFYFDSFKMPAIILLPFWIGTEFFYFYFGESHQVAYMAHAGGLMGGALLGFAAKQFLSQTRKTYFEETPEDKTPLLLEEALAKIARLDYAGARPMLLDYLSQRPDSIEALGHLFTIDKQNPGDAPFYETANRLLGELVKRRADGTTIWKKYSEFAKAANPSGLTANLQMRLVSVFCEADRLEDAEELINTLLQKKVESPNLPTLLLRFIKALNTSGMPSKAKKYQAILIKRFPMSPEAAIAKD
jgi:hypothetical protein